MKTISVVDLSGVTGGKNKGPLVPFPGGGFEQDRSKNGQLQVRYISPNGKKGPWMDQ